MQKEVLMSAIIILAIALLSVAGCGTKYEVLKESRFENPPKQRLRIVVLNLNKESDLANLTPMLFEAAITEKLKAKYVRIFPDFIGMVGPSFTTMKNPFVPLERADALTKLEEHGLPTGGAIDTKQAKQIGELLGVDVILTGQLEGRIEQKYEHLVDITGPVETDNGKRSWKITIDTGRKVYAGERLKLSAQIQLFDTQTGEAFDFFQVDEFDDLEGETGDEIAKETTEKSPKLIKQLVEQYLSHLLEKRIF